VKKDSWLLLMHQIPPKPDSLRVRVWRTLQKIGALQLKSSVYVLPEGKENQKRFQAVMKDITEGRGDAFLCVSEFIQGIDREKIIEEFSKDRDGRYKLLAEELRGLQKTLSTKRLAEDDLMAVEHSIGKLERQIYDLKEIDFFNCDEQKPTFKLLSSVLSRIEGLRNERSPTVSLKNLRDFQQTTWVTRQDIHVDRVASAWLIARFIDKKPTFRFVKENKYQRKKDECRFDMFEAEFTHVGDKCTFEVLNESFGLNDKAVTTIAEIIHDLDLKDSKFNRPETSGIGMVIRGLVKNESSDAERMKKGFALFDDLYESFKA
jgi:hypothetical protein